ncbi:class I SAM-dependent DNA methyltransferase [Paraflavisolibacter sp. H34]|uniref:class I SAM-dependent DNA methyltransferase n=1 Tax=Huijunlia imazamoxiresistens TaxID=3127457 RepID=UPI00301A5AC6
MSLQPKIDRITDILRRDDGISGAMHYTEQISWILFLKFLHDYERNKADDALLEGKTYNYVIHEDYQWEQWACSKDEQGRLDVKRQLTGDDLTRFVNSTLFPYLKGFKANVQDVKSMQYKIGSIFEFIDNRIASGHTLREVLDIVDTLNFQSSQDLFELGVVYENLLKGMGSDGGNSGEFYTPRPVIKAMVKALNPKSGQTVFDGAVGSAGFLIEAYGHMKQQPQLSTGDWKKLQEDTFFGNEKTPLAYVMGVMNMILHGIESPNIYKQNSLTQNIRDIQEKDRYDVILANPPFGGKEKPQVQQNFPVQSNATELLFLQYFMKSLKLQGQAAIVFPEGILFQTGNAFAKVKQDLLESFNVHTIVSLPAGVFLPYSGVKTNIVFFSRNGRTQNIWYYEVTPPYKLTKNKPIQEEHFNEFLELYHYSEKRGKGSLNEWTVAVNDIKDCDLSAKNPNKVVDEDHLPPMELLEQIRSNEGSILALMEEIEELLIEQKAEDE